SSWKQILFPLDRPVSVRAGDVIEIAIAMDQVDQTAQVWSWTVRIRSAETSVAEFSQSTSAAVAERPASSNGPREEPLEDVCDLYTLTFQALDLFDGHRTVRQIADDLRTRHPDVFVSADAADRFVGWLSRHWSL
ncbi:MAG: hypothetical protein HW392_1401, partial [Steroidobacteraceae bacterium]|nr:hypothetical protein [Steroidobacteraceae bacterium]